MKEISAEAEFVTEIVMDRKNVRGFDSYPFSVPAVKNMDRIKLNKPVTFIVGENGMGKSTIIEAVALCCGLNPEGGSRNFNFDTYSTHSKLHSYLRLIKTFKTPNDYYFLRAESFYNVATNIEMLDSEKGYGRSIKESYGGSLHEKSHGESFFALMKNRLGGNGLYIFDEPESALSPMRQMSMLTIINDLVNAGSQFIIATHSPILMAYPNSVIYVLSEKGITQAVYEETEHYNITKDFLNKREMFLKILME